MSLHAHISPFTSKNLALVIGEKLEFSVGSNFLISLDIMGFQGIDFQVCGISELNFLTNLKTSLL